MKSIDNSRHSSQSLGKPCAKHPWCMHDVTLHSTAGVAISHII